MYTMPDEIGYFGEYGGVFIPETLVNTLNELESAYNFFCQDNNMQDELRQLLQHYAGRPTPLYLARRLSEKYGATIYLKREDLLHTGAHKLNNTLGQILLAGYMGKKRIIAETGAGQHGVATATVAALMGMECTVYMGSVDMERQRPNVSRMKLLGAEVVPVNHGSRTLKDAINQALRDWVTNCNSTHYILGSVVGPHPFPRIVRDFQSIIGEESLTQVIEQTGGMPDDAIACVGGGSNAAGFFHPFIHSKVKLTGVEAGGRGMSDGDHCATLTTGKPGILHGCITYIIQDNNGQVLPVHSVSAGLDYPAVGPEHSFWKDSGQVSYAHCSDTQAMRACVELSRLEGIIPALESSHALGYLMEHSEKFRNRTVLINLSGRGDKDMDTILKETGL